jgi:hypothetical protein
LYKAESRGRFTKEREREKKPLQISLMVFTFVVKPLSVKDCVIQKIPFHGKLRRHLPRESDCVREGEREGGGGRGREERLTRSAAEGESIFFQSIFSSVCIRLKHTHTHRETEEEKKKRREEKRREEKRREEKREREERGN